MRFLVLIAGAAALAGCTSVQSRVVIHAPARKVAAVLFKFDQYPAWNPFIVKVGGVVAEGRQVKVTVKPVGKAEISGHTTVLTVEPKRLIWRGSLAIPGVFSGLHEFRIEDLGPNWTAFSNNEKMSGLVIPFYDFKPTEAGFAAMNQALKRRAEAR